MLIWESSNETTEAVPGKPETWRVLETVCFGAPAAVVLAQVVAGQVDGATWLLVILLVSMGLVRGLNR